MGGGYSQYDIEQQRTMQAQHRTTQAQHGLQQARYEAESQKHRLEQMQSDISSKFWSSFWPNLNELFQHVCLFIGILAVIALIIWVLWELYKYNKEAQKLRHDTEMQRLKRENEATLRRKELEQQMELKYKEFEHQAALKQKELQQAAILHERKLNQDAEVEARKYKLEVMKLYTGVFKELHHTSPSLDSHAITAALQDITHMVITSDQPARSMLTGSSSFAMPVRNEFPHFSRKPASSCGSGADARQSESSWEQPSVASRGRKGARHRCQPNPSQNE